jgi:hypothetical protein
MPPAPETVEVDFIAPRHLAGGGDPAWITVPLHRACGWNHGNDPLMPRVLLSSPDQKALLRLEPEPEPDGQWWTLHHAAEPDRPAWYASFGALTPVELIAAVTDALTDPAATTITPSDPYEPLQQIGWSPASADNGLVSPDATAYVEWLGSAEEPGAWFVTAALGPDRPVWQARFGAHTPAHLLAAFTTALADPKPVLRMDSGRSLPTRDPNVVTRRSTDVLAVYVAGALEERVHTFAARHATPPTSLNPSRQPPAKNSRSR